MTMRNGLLGPNVLLALVVLLWLPAAEVQAGLVAYWPADGDFLDASGNGHHGTPFNGVTFEGSGRVGQAFSFDGNLAQNVRVADHGDFDFGTGDFSIVMWVRPDQNVGNGHGMIAKDSFGLEPSYPGWLVNEADALGGLGLQTRRGGVADTNARSTTRITPGTWGHVAAVRENGMLRFYTGTQLRASVTEATATDVSNTAPLTIGSLYPSPSPQHFSGDIDEIAIFDHALSPAEIASIYTDGVLPKASMAAPGFSNQGPPSIDGPILFESFEEFTPGTLAPFTTTTGVTVAAGPFADVDIHDCSDWGISGNCVRYFGGFSDAEVTFSFPYPIQMFQTFVLDLGTNGPTTLEISTPSTGSQLLYENYTGSPGNLQYAGVWDPAGFSVVTLSNSEFSDGIGFAFVGHGVAFEECTPAPWILYRPYPTEQTLQFASVDDIVSGSIACASGDRLQPLVPTGWDDLASDGTTWVLYDQTTERIARFSSLTSLALGLAIAGVETITPTGFQRIGADDETWALYDQENFEIARYTSLADLVAGNSIAGREPIGALLPASDIASDGSTWVLLSAEGDLRRYDSITELITDDASAVDALPVGSPAIGAAVPVPEPVLIHGILAGSTLLYLLSVRRKGVRPAAK